MGRRVHDRGMKSETATAALCIAINAQLPLEAAPEWVQLLPAGPKISGRDGREWLPPLPGAVTAAFARLGRSLVLDWEHATEIKSPKGERAPAAGRVDELREDPDGSVWGRVIWTPQGADDVRTGAYRYLSPVFLFDKVSRRITELRGAGLVHEPNLPMAALNRAADEPTPEQQEQTMNLSKVYAALGLVDGANEDQILTAVNQLKDDRQTALNKAETPNLEKYVPRADYDQALERATNAEKALAEHKGKAIESEAEALIAQAQTEGKIAPASAEYYRAMCKSEEGLTAFKAFIETAPKVVAESPVAGKGAPDAGTAANGEQLTEEERAICRQLGITDEQFLKTKGGK